MLRRQRKVPKSVDRPCVCLWVLGAGRVDAGGREPLLRCPADAVAHRARELRRDAQARGLARRPHGASAQVPVTASVMLVPRSSTRGDRILGGKCEGRAVRLEKAAPSPGAGAASVRGAGAPWAPCCVRASGARPRPRWPLRSLICLRGRLSSCRCFPRSHNGVF